MGAYFCMCAYKRDVVVVIKMGVYIHGVLIFCGYLLPRFYGMYILMWPVWMFVVGKYPVSHLKPALQAFMTKHRLVHG